MLGILDGFYIISAGNWIGRLVGNPYDTSDKGTAGDIYRHDMFAGDPTGGLSNLPRIDPLSTEAHVRRLEDLVESLTRRVSSLEDMVSGIVRGEG
jgi:hypothetical protein